MSNLRIPGLASGMDTDAMVQSLMKVERLKVDRFEQSKQIALWRQEAYNSMNKMFANFILNTKKDMGLTRVTSTGVALGNSYSNLDYVRKATSSNETAATVSATSKAVNGSYTITVDNLATSGSYASSEITTLGDNLDFKLKVGTGANQKSIDIKVTKLTDNDETMEEIVKKINAEKIGVTAFYDKNNKRLFMQTAVTGKDAKIELTKLDGTAFSGGDPFGGIATSGVDAKIKFNGVDLFYSSNNFNLNGLNIQLKKAGETTTINVDTNIDGIMEKIEKFVNDYNELVDKVSKSINEKRYPGYHPLSQEERKAMHEDDAKLWMEKAKSGMLNRDETMQKTLQAIRNDLYADVKSISKDGLNHITKIGITTEKYSRGTTGGKLQIDKDKLRQAIEKDPEGVMELLFAEPNKLAREMDKFPDTEEGNKKYEAAERINRRDNGGIFTRVYDNLIDGMKSIIDKSGPGEDSDLFRNVKSNILIDFVSKKSSISDLDKEVLDTNKRIDDLNAMLYRKENAYYAKFANMEKMLQQMNSQSNWLSQQFMR